MSNNYFSTEYLNRNLNDEVWDDLSREFKWTLPYLSKYADRVNWSLVSGNSEMMWSGAMLEAFKSRIDWHELSESGHQCIFTTANLDKYADYWAWGRLSENRNFPFSIELLDRYADRWDWAEIIDNYGVEDTVGLNRAFLERYKDRIPAERIQDSRLWRNLEEERKFEVASEILGADA